MDKKEALDIVRKLYYNSLFLKDDKEAVRTLIPEVEDIESEDERIKRGLLRCLDDIEDGWIALHGISKNDAIAYLEKQKEQKPTTPKYRVGEVMRTKQEAAKGITDGLPVIVSVDDNYYYCTNEKIPISKQEEYEFPSMNMRQNPAEWNEDNKLPIDAAIYWLERRLEAEEACDISTRTCPLTMRETIEKLKSLRPQPHWKPSEEQMYVLNRAISELESKEHIAENYAPLKKLRDQLKKLL